MFRGVCVINYFFFMPAYDRVLEKLQARLQSHDWLVGDKTTIADLCWAPNLRFIVDVAWFDFPLDRYRGVEDWYKRLCKTSKGFQEGAMSPKHDVPSAAHVTIRGVKGRLFNN